MNGHSACKSHNETARIAESYNSLYASFCSDEIKQVGNYTIIKLIGEGAFGKVYLANHTLTHSKVVLKTGFKDDPNLVREVFYHRQFKHPNITRLYEVIVSDGKIWMVLEYCPGKELYDHVLSCGRIEPDEVKKLFSQIASSVYYAHSLNCVHRDLKLENILLDKKKNAKLSDFGFTREFEPRGVLETVCGTTVYMAPELLRKKRYDGFKADVWSLGVILYTLLYGEMPFDEDDEIKTQYNIINTEPVYKNDIPQEAINLIQKLLQKSPSGRPSVHEILTDPFLEAKGQAELDVSDKLIKNLAANKTFNSKVEKYLLKKLKSSGIDTHTLKKSVLSKNCDSLSGLWELLLEKQKKSEVRRYKAGRSRSVLRISESTSRRVSQFMENSPAISRIVSQISTNTNTGGGGSSSVNNVPIQHSPQNNKYPSSFAKTSTDNHSTDDHSNFNESGISSPEKKKNKFMARITKLWKRKDDHQPYSNNLTPVNSKISSASQIQLEDNIAYPQQQYQYSNDQPGAKISFSKPTFQPNRKRLQKQNQQDQQFAKDEISPSPGTSNIEVQTPEQPQKSSQLGMSTSTSTLERNGQVEEQLSSQSLQPVQLTIKEPRSPTRFASGKSSRPRSIMSQHSVLSQYTTKSDISIASSLSDTRGSFTRKVSSDTSLQSKSGIGNATKRSLSLISSNSSNSERSSRRSSIYEGSPTMGSSSLTNDLKFKASSSFPRGKRTYNEGAIFPKSFRRRKSPLGGVSLSGSRFRRSKTLIIEEEEDDDDELDSSRIANDDEGGFEEDEDLLDGINTDMEDLDIVESTRKSSDFESDLNEERGRQLQR